MTITQDDLRQFTGTEGYTRVNFFGKRVLLTDGANYLAENGASWLIDIIMSVFPRWGGEDFVSVKLTVKNEEGLVVMDDGNGNIIYSQKIEFTDFKFNLKLFVVNYEGTEPVIMLASEY